MAAPGDDLLRRKRLLSMLPDTQRAQIAPSLELVSLRVRDRMFDTGEPIGHVHFPVEGVISLVATLEEREVEIATVGNEGMLGLPVFLQAAMTSSHRAFCQVPARTLRMSTASFDETLAANGISIRRCIATPRRCSRRSARTPHATPPTRSNSERRAGFS